MPLSQIKFNYEEKSVIWITKRLTESHLFSVLCSVYIFALSCYSNEDVTTFKRDTIRLWVQALATTTAVYAMWLEVYWFPPAKSLTKDIHFSRPTCWGTFTFLTYGSKRYALYTRYLVLSRNLQSIFQAIMVQTGLLKFCYSIMPFVHSTAVMLAPVLQILLV